MNKPVAWMNKQMDYIIHNNWKENTANPDAHYYTIPLYTHPVKELTDEEILEIVSDKYEKGHGRYIDTDLFFIEFAKAILRKAQDK